MPIKWVPELDQLLLLLLLDTHPFKIDPDLIVAAWPTDRGDIPTARSITERFVRIRRTAAAKYGKTIGKASGKASARISISSSSPGNKGGRALENTNVTPHKLGSSAPVTPKNKRTTGKTTPASKKRKVNKESSDAEESSDANVEPPAHVSRRKARELNDSPSTGRGSQSVASMDTGSALKTGTTKPHGQSQASVIGGSEQSYSYGQDLPDTVMAPELNTDEELTFSHALQTGHGSVYGYPAVGTQTLESDDWTAYQPLSSEQANEGSADGPYGGNFGVNYNQSTGYPRDVYDNDVVYVDSSIQSVPVHLRRQPPLPTAFSAAHNMPQSHASAEADGFVKHDDFVDDNGDDERDDARRSASPMPSRPRTRREVSRRAAVKHERDEEFGTEGSSIGESEYSNYTEPGEYI